METCGHSRIAGIGAFLPEQRVGSDELFAEVHPERFGIPVNYISKHIGILERRFADPGMEPSDLATLASEVALRDSGVTPADIDLILFTGITKDCEEPSTAHFVQNKLGAKNAVCMDVSNACLGFMTGLSVADAYISSGAAETVLVCTGEIQSGTLREFINLLKTTTDKVQFKRTLGVLTVGDAGGAMVVHKRPDSGEGWQWIRFISRGVHAKLCHYKKHSGGVEGEMLMMEISKELVNLNAEVVGHTFESLNWGSDTISKLYCHQVGRKPHQMLAELACQPIENAPITYDQFGNLTSATIPINMYLNPPRRGERILFFGSGSGLTICHAGMVF